MSLHIVHFSGAINANACFNVQSCCFQALNAGATRIRLHISSDGGSTGYGFALFNFLRSLPVPVDTHNLGNVGSMANIMFLAGEQRTAARHSRFLLHPLHYNYNAGMVDHSRLLEHGRILDDDLDRYVDIFMERTQGAATPFDIRNCLNGSAEIVNPAGAAAAGLIFEIADVSVPTDAFKWWATA
ncbi:ATP-dependent Clp protease proteolytic subunit [Pseudomonas guariconensis]|nr:ATP-dependent Clp protease proteolytic subunit [Pseudomonas guariconensis]MBF8756512.1 ATP-dependent Clp protease proteolytic subunit [Pseudomonas guariconensis]